MAMLPLLGGLFLAHFKCCASRPIYDGTFNLNKLSMLAPREERIPPGHIQFQPLGNCTTGVPSYVGLINPAKLTHPNKFFIEISGGAVCFNKSSCEDSSLRRWTDIKVLLTQFMHVPEVMYELLTAGIPIFLPLMADLEPGWIPGMATEGTHPLDGMRGIYMPACTADIGVGRVDTDYEGKQYSHHGGIGIRSILTAVKELIPDVTDFYLYGGSGGGVSSVAWAPSVADSFPNAQVRALVDSGFHMMPGTDIFKTFYDEVPWSQGPGKNNASKIYTEFDVPKFNWLDIRSIANELSRYEGRVKVAYIGCNNDHIVYSDRKLIGKYVFSYNETFHLGTQVEFMWNFLTSTHKCAPEGTVASWVADCTAHHLTRSMGKFWATNESHGESSGVFVKDSISAMDFVHNFFYGVPLDPANPEKYQFWYDDRADQMATTTCSDSEIRIANGAMLSSPVSGWLTVAVPYILSLAWM